MFTFTTIVISAYGQSDWHKHSQTACLAFLIVYRIKTRSRQVRNSINSTTRAHNVAGGGEWLARCWPRPRTHTHTHTCCLCTVLGGWAGALAAMLDKTLSCHPACRACVIYVHSSLPVRPVDLSVCLSADDKRLASQGSVAPQSFRRPHSASLVRLRRARSSHKRRLDLQNCHVVGTAE